MIKGTRTADSKGLTLPKCPWSPDGHLDCNRYYMVLQSKLCIDLHCCMFRNHMKTRSNIGPIRASQVSLNDSLQFKPRCSPWSLASAMIVFSLAPSLSRASRSSWRHSEIWESKNQFQLVTIICCPYWVDITCFFFGSTLLHATIAKTCYVSMSNQLAFELNVPGLRMTNV